MDPLKNISIRNISEATQETAESTTKQQQPASGGISNLPDTLESTPELTSLFGSSGFAIPQGEEGSTIRVVSQPNEDVTFTKIKIDNKAIDAGLEEAKQKASLAHQQAVSALAGGIVGSLENILGKSSPEITALHRRLDFLISSSENAPLSSNALQIQISQQELQIDLEGLQKDADTSDINRIKQAILDFLSKLGDTNPKL
ncbi:MAG: hypothetical protein C5B54_02390 [Acidobacteria bacterium]|nr:MAG: hypothetical protein C5B54_02390 [Acidobacteriota bacterium]